MQKLLVLCGLILLSSLAAFAQIDVSTVAPPSEPTASPASPQVSRPELTDWQMTFGYMFNRFNMPANQVGNKIQPQFTTNDNGWDVTFTRFLINWGGLEADVAPGFGSTSSPQIKYANSLFFGGGPHFAVRGHGRFEPWVHGLVGLEHFRFSQTAVQYGSNNSVGFIAGGGADLHLNPRTAIRVQGDYVGTILFSEPQHSWQVGAGIVLNF